MNTSSSTQKSPPSSPVALPSSPVSLPNSPRVDNKPVSAVATKVVTVESGVGKYIFSVFHSIISLVAIYLTFRCNQKFDFGSFIMALLFPYIYIVYILATRGTCGIVSAENK
jgi:hypothetical protein